MIWPTATSVPTCTVSSEKLDKIVAQVQPDELYLPFPSVHQDHIATYEAGVRAGRLSMSEGHWFTRSLYVYDVAAYDVNLYPSDLRWNVFEPFTEKQIDMKVAALEAYATQAVSGPHPTNSIKQSASVTGHARQVAWAEPFALVREVRTDDLRRPSTRPAALQWVFLQDGQDRHLRRQDLGPVRGSAAISAA